MSATSLRLLLVVCLFSLVQTAWADGGMFPRQFAGSAESADQRAIVVYDGGHETLILQTAYEGDGGDFAWVIPVPALLGAGDIGTVAPDIFDDLYYLTEPTAYGYFGYNAQGVFGCSSSTAREYQSVRVWEPLQVDDYEVTILSADDSSDLVEWLNANGYAYPAGHQGELNYYVNKSWFFVAAKISLTDGRNGNNGPPSTGGDYGEEGEEMRPLRLSFNTAEPVYPMRISAVSSEDEIEVLVYIIARHRMRSTNFNTEQVQLTSQFHGGDFPAYYEEQFRSSLARAGVGSLLVEYAGHLPRYLVNIHGADLGLGAGEFYITRLRTYLTHNEMQEDVVMTQAATDNNFAIYVMAPVTPDTNIRLAGIGLLFALAAMLGFTSGNRHNLIRALLLAAVIALLMV